MAFSAINNTVSDSSQAQSNMTLECSNRTSICLKDFDESGVNLKYKGNKNYKEKGMFSECPEVLKKNLLRSIRRYLSEQYVSFKSKLKSFMGSRHVSKRNYIIEFYNENIKSQSFSAKNVSQNEELGIFHILGILFQENIVFRNDTVQHRTLKKNMNKLLKTFSRKLFDSISSMSEFKKLILILKEAGVIAQIIEAYPTLSKSKEAYEITIQEIIQANN